ncbi:MAG: ATP-binding cassette domain-containing protein [Anaerovoracaceae bacterium]
MGTTVLETRSLRRVFGQKTAVDKVSLSVEKASLYALVGSIGSGKTTLLEIIANQLTPGSGEVIINGKKQTGFSHAPVGYMKEVPAFDPYLTVAENISAKLSLMRGAGKDPAEIIELWGIENIKDRKAAELSSAERRIAGAAMASAGYPEIVLMDDPCAGLTPSESEKFLDTVNKLREDKKMTFIVTSRTFDTAVRNADITGFLKAGRLVSQISRDELEKRARFDLRLRVDDMEKTKKILKKFEVAEKDGWLLVGSGSLQTSAVNEALIKSGVNVFEIKPGTRDIEDVFADIMEGGRYA